ncbi:MAG: [ribosomal protein S18]-alanine N-acetyltransferase [Acidobacteriota bacterium]|jgi:ribosomal-protein-alanine N-acetyltransferase
MAEQRAAPAPEGISIHRMSEHDLLEVVEIEEQSGLSRWGWAAYYAELQGANRDLMLIARPVAAVVESTPIAGYIVARETAGELHINNFAVRSGFRRRGIGTALLEKVLQEARNRKANAAFLEVRSTNLVAQALYERSGFQAIARRAKYYSDPLEDAVVMTLNLG